MNKDDVLAKFVGNNKCLGKPDHAVNIEGVAAKDSMFTLVFASRLKTNTHTFSL